MPTHPICYTESYNKISKTLKCQIFIGRAIESVRGLSLKDFHEQEFIALWDTGATHSVITSRVVEALNLKLIGQTKVHTANDLDKPVLADVYLVSLCLPNGLAFQNVLVTKLKVTNSDAIIGMDIISKGDFAVSSFEGKTTFTYRCPSKRKIDFEKEND